MVWQHVTRRFNMIQLSPVKHCVDQQVALNRCLQLQTCPPDGLMTSPMDIFPDRRTGRIATFLLIAFLWFVCKCISVCQCSFKEGMNIKRRGTEDKIDQSIEINPLRLYRSVNDDLNPTANFSGPPGSAPLPSRSGSCASCRSAT